MNRRAADVGGQLELASLVSTVDLHWGDLEEELSRDFVHPLPETLLLAG